MVLERSYSADSPSSGRASLRRLHALSGVVALGAFIVLHWVEQSAAFGGRAGQARSLTGPHSPLLLALEIGLVYVPLLFHAGYGLLTGLERVRPARGAARGRLAHRPVERRTLQLATGVVTALFLLVYSWQFRVRLWTGELEPGDFHDELCASLSSTAFGGLPLAALGHLCALAAVAFHFSSGLHGACQPWVIARSRWAARALTGVFVAAGVGLFVLGAITVVHFATGSASLPSAGH